MAFCQENRVSPIYLEYVTDAVDSGKPVDVIYLDFQKAFDKVPHARLLNKLLAHGISGKILQWIGEWLKGRQQSGSKW